MLRFRIEKNPEVERELEMIFPDQIQKKIDEKYEESADYTEILSANCRKIAFAEGSLYWFLQSYFNLGAIILLGLLCLILFFITDAIQYYNGYKNCERQAERFKANKRKMKDNSDDYEDDLYFHNPIDLPFKIKLIFLSVATFLLLIAFYWSFCNLSPFC